jgi:hypothetical protein
MLQKIHFVLIQKLSSILMTTKMWNDLHIIVRNNFIAMWKKIYI